MSKTFIYEDVAFDSMLPVKIFKLHHDSNEKGCSYHWHESYEFYYVVNGSLKLSSKEYPSVYIR